MVHFNVNEQGIFQNWLTFICHSSNFPHNDAMKNEEKQILANQVQSENSLSKVEKENFICLGVHFDFYFKF